MSDKQATSEEAKDKGKLLASMISKGFSYFESKKILEEHEWNVEKALASSLAKEKRAGTGDESDAHETETKKVTPPSSESGWYEEGPQYSPSHAVGARSWNCSPVAKSPRSDTTALSTPTRNHEDMDSLFTAEYGAFVSNTDENPFWNNKEETVDNDEADFGISTDRRSGGDGIAVNTDARTHEDRDSLFAYGAFVNSTEDSHTGTDAGNVGSGGRRSVPGAFREGGPTELDEETTTTNWTPDNDDGLNLSSQQTYMAVAEVVREPEFVNATPQEESEYAKTPTDDSKGENQRWWVSRRRFLLLSAFVGLLAIGVVVALVAALTKQSVDDNPGGRGEFPTASPTITPTPTALPEVYDVLGVFFDDEEGTEPDLIEFKVLASDTNVAFELRFRESSGTKNVSFLIDMKAEKS